ncbi:MAG: hypothetical protein RIA62_10390 [Cyclobacteriaceae bacterium]
MNDKPEQHGGAWPMIGSPYVSMQNSVLEIETEKGKITVDWTGTYPKITKPGQP